MNIKRIIREEVNNYRSDINPNYDGTKESLKGMKMYHGTIKIGWKNRDNDYLFITEDFEHAKWHAEERAKDISKYENIDTTAIVVEVPIDDDIINLEWLVDDDEGRYTELGFHEWQDSYSRHGSFVIMGRYDIDKFPIIYEKEYHSKR